IAAQVINQIGNPEAIKQGIKNTCAPAVDESSLARSNPAKYAEHVASLVTEGRLLGKDVSGTVSSDKLKYDGEPNRTLTSRIFQTGVVALTLPEGETYVSTRPTRNNSSGEWVNRNGKWEPFTGTNVQTVEQLSRLRNDLAAEPTPDYGKNPPVRTGAD